MILKNKKRGNQEWFPLFLCLYISSQSVCKSKFNTFIKRINYNIYTFANNPKKIEMIYTKDKRKALNKAFLEKYPQPDISTNGMSYLYTTKLLDSLTAVESVRSLKKIIPVTAFPFRVVLPVMYRRTIINDKNEHQEIFEISYVNYTDKSLEMAEKWINNKSLWMFPELITL